MAETASELQLVLSLASRVCQWKVGEHGQKKLAPKGERKESGNSERKKNSCGCLNDSYVRVALPTCCQPSSKHIGKALLDSGTCSAGNLS